MGREQELRWLSSRLASHENPHKLLLVTGPAGIGKTRLVAEAVTADRTLASITFPQGRFALPGHGLRRLAELRSDPGNALRAQLSSGEEPHASHLHSIFKAADKLLMSEPDKIVILDDLQWADELTLGWLAQTELFGSDTPSRIVATVRMVQRLPDRLGNALLPLQRREAVDSLQIVPFDVTTVGELAVSLGHPDPESFAEGLHSLTDGVPLSVIEVLQQLQRRGLSVRSMRGDWAIEMSELPIITAIVREQALEAGEDARRLIGVTCLAPQPASERLVRRVTGFDRSRFDRALNAAIASGLILEERSGSLRFRHELQREAFHLELSLIDRRELHRQIAQVLATGTDKPAGPIAYHLVESGQIDEALEWFERAALQSMRAHDHGNALAYLRAALELCAAEQEQLSVRLCDLVVQAARSSNQIDLGLDLVSLAEENVRTEVALSHLLICRGRLLSYGGDFDGRDAALQEAKEHFEHGNDHDGLALALGELAFPLAGSLTLAERVAAGAEALSLAEGSKDVRLFALCAINLASATFYTGSPKAFSLWQRAAAALREAGEERSELAARNLNNWSLGALSWGNHAAAARILREGLAIAPSPFWKNSFFANEAVHLWRVGRWDEASLAAERVITGTARPQVKAIATAIQAGIAFEREARPDISPLEAATQTLFEWSDEEFGTIAYAILTRARGARREPHPARGCTAVAELILTSGISAGWDDLPPAVAEVDPIACRRLFRLFGNLRPKGLRARANLRLTEGLLARRGRPGEAAVILSDAADQFKAVGEPYAAARCLAAAADALGSGSRRAGSMKGEAADIFQAIGADRSLAGLLRSGQGARSLARFKIPQDQRGRSSPGLTKRESEVAKLAGQGYTAREIGERLGITTVTVKKHLEHVRAKFGVSRKSELIRLMAPIDSTEWPGGLAR